MALIAKRESGEDGRETAAPPAPPAVGCNREVGGDLHLETVDDPHARAVTGCLSKLFAQRHGVNVRVTAFGNDDERVDRIRSGRSRADVTLLDGKAMHAAIAADAMLPLRLQNIPNFAGQHIRFRETAREVGRGACYGSALVWETPQSATTPTSSRRNRPRGRTSSAST